MAGRKKFVQINKNISIRAILQASFSLTQFTNNQKIAFIISYFFYYLKLQICWAMAIFFRLTKMSKLLSLQLLKLRI
jgi:hypothetical protein